MQPTPRASNESQGFFHDPTLIAQHHAGRYSWEDLAFWLIFGDTLTPDFQRLSTSGTGDIPAPQGRQPNLSQLFDTEAMRRDLSEFAGTLLAGARTASDTLRRLPCNPFLWDLYFGSNMRLYQR